MKLNIHLIFIVRFVQNFAINAERGISSRMNLIEKSDEERKQTVLKNKEITKQLPLVAKQVIRSWLISMQIQVRHCMSCMFLILQNTKSKFIQGTLCCIKTQMSLLMSAFFLSNLDQRDKGTFPSHVVCRLSSSSTFTKCSANQKGRHVYFKNVLNIDILTGEKWSNS